MNNRANNVLLTLFFTGLVGLWAAQYFGVLDRNARTRANPRVLPELLETKPDDLERLEITGGEAKKLVFERRAGNRWQMIEPVDTAADAAKVEALAFTLKELNKPRDIGNPEGSLASFGLEPPEHTITLFGKDKSKPLASLDIGKEVQGMRYVRSKSSGRVEVVDAKPLGSADTSPLGWRDRMLVQMPTHLVNTLEVTGEGRALVVEREGDLWHITKPIKALGDDNRIDGAVAEVVSARVGDVGFIADDVSDFKKYGLDPPVATFTVTSKKGDKTDTQRFHIGKPVESTNDASRVYARRDDQNEVVAIDAKMLKSIGINPFDLHAKKLADFKPALVKFIRLKTGDTTVSLVRNGEQWVRVAPLNDTADKPLVEDVLKKLDEAEASAIYPPGQAKDTELETPWAVVEIWHNVEFSDGEPKNPPRVAIKIGKRDALNKIALCQIEGDPSVMSVPLPFVKDIPAGPLAFRDRIVASVPVRELDSVNINVDDKGRALKAPATLDPQGWRMVDPFDAKADAEAIQRLMFTLANLRAESLLTEKAAEKLDLGFENPHVIVTWTTRPTDPEPPKRPKEATTTTLKIGKQVDRTGKRFAKTSTSPIVFILSPDIVESFKSEWHDRKVISFDPTKVEKLIIGWPSLGLTFRPVADASSPNKEPQWVVVDPPSGLSFDTAKVKPVIKSLSTLKTFKFSQYSGLIKDDTRLFPPRLRFDIHMNDGTMTRLSIGAISNGYLLATTATDNKDGPIFQLPLSGWEPWLASPKLANEVNRPAEPKK